MRKELQVAELKEFASDLIGPGLSWARTGTGTVDSGIGTSGRAGTVRESHLFEIDLLHGP
jgi:hypothetical protein